MLILANLAETYAELKLLKELNLDYLHYHKISHTDATAKLLSCYSSAHLQYAKGSGTAAGCPLRLLEI